MTHHPFPVKFNDEQRERIETLKAACNNVPKYSELLRKALDLGLTQMSSMPADQLAKEIRGF